MVPPGDTGIDPGAGTHPVAQERGAAYGLVVTEAGRDTAEEREKGRGDVLKSVGACF